MKKQNTSRTENLFKGIKRAFTNRLPGEGEQRVIENRWINVASANGTFHYIKC